MRFFTRRTSPQPAATPAVPPAPGATPAGQAGNEHDQQLPGITLHYAEWGPPAAPERTVMLLHGLTASHREFAILGPALAEHGWHVVAPDLRGRGLSSKPPHGYGDAINANDILALGDALGLGRMHIVGHSRGAVIGMFLAAFAPQRVGKLALLDAGGTIPDDTMQAIGASVARLGTVYPSLDDYLGLMRQLPMLQWNDFWEAYFRYDADVRPDGSVVSRVLKSAIEEEGLALALTRAELLPSLVRCPTLIVRATVGLLGPDRGLILPRAEADRMLGIIPESRLVEIDGKNHYTMMLADTLVDALRTFLAEPAPAR